MAVDTVPVSEGSKKENRYAFRLRDGGKVFSVPKLQYLSGKGTDFLDEAIEQGLDEIRLTRALIAIECPEAAEGARNLAADQVMWISKRWAEASTITVGESEGSDES
ncbi:hypothetical protein ACFU44_00365 [Nocardia rhizosphaerihabitans]|uniref:hypothetical protein n=1 Tax=Nocardia rhizosphaerihabitans TaxID=1691570 RepID=UPI00366C16BB